MGNHKLSEKIITRMEELNLPIELLEKKLIECGVLSKHSEDYIIAYIEDLASKRSNAYLSSIDELDPNENEADLIRSGLIEINIDEIE